MMRVIDYLDYRADIWQILCVTRDGQAIAADDTVELFVCACLDLRVCRYEREEPLQDCSALVKKTVSDDKQGNSYGL